MDKQNFDGIKFYKKTTLVPAKSLPHGRILSMDGVVKQPARHLQKIKIVATSKQVHLGKPVFKNLKHRQALRPWWRRFTKQLTVPAVAAALSLLLAFFGGMWFVMSSRSSRAADQPQVLGDFTNQPSSLALPNAQLPPQNSVSNDVLFNTPIQQLQNYLATVSQPDIIAERAAKIKQYLTDKKSPLAAAAEIIAEQPHWNLILPIAFAESSLGKNCNDNNCSNIGVRPGAPSWRKYSSYQAWVVDFNRLLDKKYNNWTLEQMCGVYVKPCNPNWLLATKEVLDDLQQAHIE